MDGIRFFAPKTVPCQSTEIPTRMHNTHASPTTLRVADDVESTIPGPATSSSNRYHHPLPEDYDDQVALLYMRIQELKQLFEDFVKAQEKMKVFRDLKVPFGRLVVSPNVVRVTLDEFCNAVKWVRSSSYLI